MGFRTRCTILAVPALAVALAAGGNKPSEQQQEPRYDGATVVDQNFVVVEVREVPKGSPLAGIHVMARPESSHSDSDAVDVYVCPVAFLKFMEFTFRQRDRIEVTGSKVKFGNTTVILSREVRRDDSTLYIRDRNGEPLWKAVLKDPS